MKGASFWLWVNETLVKFKDGDVVSVRGDEERQKGLCFVRGEVKREAIVDVIAKRRRREET